MIPHIEQWTRAFAGEVTASGVIARLILPESISDRTPRLRSVIAATIFGGNYCETVLKDAHE